ncbi:MAG: hypothetical protein GY754_46495 [bacterium]|nr:hypothetical protein [bacterium]
MKVSKSIAVGCLRLFMILLVAVSLPFCDVKEDDKDREKWAAAVGNRDYDFVAGIFQEADGGYVFASRSNLRNGSDVFTNPRPGAWLVNLSSSGGIQSQTGYAGASVNDFDRNTLGGFTMAGSCLTDLDADGNILWSNSYLEELAGGEQRLCRVYSTALLSSGNRVSLWNGEGNEDSNGVFCVNSNGELLWAKTLPAVETGVHDMTEGNIEPTADGGFVVLETTANEGSGTPPGYSNGYGSLWILRFDANGTLLWQKVLNSALDGFSNDNTALRVTSDGGFLLAGSAYKNNSSEEDIRGAMIVKLNSVGSLEWAKIYSAKNSRGENRGYATDIIETSQGGYLFTGLSYDSMWNVKLQANGNVEWAKEYIKPSETKPICVKERTNGAGYVIAAETFYWNTTGNYDVLVFTTDLQGNIPGDYVQIESISPAVAEVTGDLELFDTDGQAAPAAITTVAKTDIEIIAGEGVVRF